jgi:uridine kinase
MINPFVLGVIGDSGSGKNTLADAVEALLGPARVVDVTLDDYHRFTREERATRGVTALNPMVHNIPLMSEHLQLLRDGRPIRNRSYDHADGTFGPIRTIEPSEIILVRGLLGYPTDEMRALYHLTVFLHPEPELLFRWKLRRDVLSRGYSEAEVLKRIAHHLLDSKEFILPQSERADVVVRHELPDWEATDSAIRTSLLLRREVAELARQGNLCDGVGGVTCEERGEEEVVLSLSETMSEEEVAAWGRALFPATYDAPRVGVYTEDGGGIAHRPQLAFVEIFIARATNVLREQG